MLQRGLQKITEPPPTAFNRAQNAFLQEAGEKFLGQVLRFMFVVALAADVKVERPPIGEAELVQGRGGLSGRT